MANAGRLASSAGSFLADNENWQGSYASKTSSFERRADEWVFQGRLAARELAQIGRHILGALIAEQIAYREYVNVQEQIAQSQEVDQFLHDKYSSEELYVWMQGELSRLYYEYYRFAFDTARKAEQTMKRELMRPELDATDYIKFNYWDGGRKGLLCGEALYLDIKRMEMAYHEQNKRELELTKHVSLRQLNPIALLTLKATGSCDVEIPEWVYDFDCPGHYLRRLKTVSLSIPSIAGPYTSVNCTLSLLRSTIRTSPLVNGDYRREGSEDTRFVDAFGTVQQMVTSSGNNDSGMFETTLSDPRFLHFEGAGALSTWRLDLPSAFRQFDYDSISDVILHVRYTARQGGGLLATKATEYLEELVSEANAAGLAVLLSLKHEFPSEWHKFVAANMDTPTPAVPFLARIKRDRFPLFTQGRQIELTSVQVHRIQDGAVTPSTLAALDLAALTDALTETGGFDLSLPAEINGVALTQGQPFLVLKYAVTPS